MFAPFLWATFRMAQIWVWLMILLIAAVMISTAVSTLFPSRMFIGLKWGVLAAFFGLSVVVLFSYLKSARTIDDGHLLTAVSSYLLLGLQWFGLYSAIDVLSPGSIPRSASVAAERNAEIVVLQFGNSFNDRFRRCCPTAW